MKPKTRHETRKKAGPWLKLALAVVAAVILLAAARYFHVQDILKKSLGWVAGLGSLGPILFIGIYILACVLFIPGSILTLGAGFVFGVVKGSVTVSIAATLGATCAFLVGRYLARNWVTTMIEGNPKFEALDEAVAKEGWKIVGLVRLSPVFPFNLLNYAFGLTKVRLRHYFFASWIGMLPGTVVYVYIGSLASDLATLGEGGRRTAAEWALYILGLVATVTVTVYVTRLARKALERKI